MVKNEKGKKTKEVTLNIELFLYISADPISTHAVFR